MFDRADACVLLALAVVLIVLVAAAYAFGWVLRQFNADHPNELDTEFAADFDARQAERARAEAEQRREAEQQVARTKFGGPLREGSEL